MSIAGVIIDIYDDVLADGMTKLASHLPENLINHNLHEPEDIEKLSDDDFAAVMYTDNGNKVRRYPIDSPEEAQLSGIYFGMNQEKFHKTAQSIVAKKIKQSFDRFGIETWDELDKLADGDTGEGYINLLKYPMKSKQSVVVREAAIEKTASQEVNRDVYGDSLVFDINIQRRKSFIKEASKKSLDELVEKKDTMSPSRFCDELSEFDKEANINQYWGSRILDPDSTVFYPEVKMPMVKVGSAEVSEERILEISKNAGGLKEVLTDDMVDEFQKDPVTIFRSLPFPTQNLILNG